MKTPLRVVLCLQTLLLTGCLQSENPLFSTADTRAIPELDGAWVQHGTPRELQRVKLDRDGSYATEDLSGQPTKERVAFMPLANDAYLVERCLNGCLYLIALRTTGGIDVRDIADTETVYSLATEQGLSLSKDSDGLSPDTRADALLGFYKAVLTKRLLGKLIAHYDFVPPALVKLLEDPEQTQDAARAAEERKEYATALASYQPLADGNYIPAQLRLARLYLLGMGVPHDPKIAVSWFERAAGHGDALAQRITGEYYLAGRGVERSDATAAAYLRKAADQGDAPAQYELGLLYQAGRGVAPDDREAVTWYRKAAMQGDADAQNALGIHYEDGQGVAKDDKHAASWYRKAVDQGSAAAQYNLSQLYADGRGVPRSTPMALDLLRKAAEQDLPEAQFGLGTLYASGTGGLPKNDTLTVQWISKAAAQDFAGAQNYLGTLYERGQGVPQDAERSADWYRKAAEQGNPVAQFNLGSLYEASSNRHQYDAQAATWYQKAAAQGFADAQVNLARLYLQGWGVPKNEDQGMTLLNAAAKQGNAVAKKTLDSIKSDTEDRALMFQAIVMGLGGLRWEGSSAPVMQFPAMETVPCYSKEEFRCTWE